MTPLRQIKTPVYLELFEGAVRSVVVKMLDPSGEECKGVPIGLRHRDLGIGYQCQSGERIVLRHGTYDLLPTQGDVALFEALMGVSLDVDEASPDQLVVNLRQAVSPVEIRVHYPSDQVLGPLSLYIDSEKGTGPAIANYRPERGVIKRWLTGKTMVVRVRSVAYQDLDHEPVEISPGKVTQLDLHIVEK